MSGNQDVTVDQDSLGLIARGFDHEAQQLTAQLRKLSELVAQLRGGDWVGLAAQAFYAELDDLVLPSFARMREALDAGGQMTRQIISRMQEADADMTRIFRSRPSAPTSDTASDTSAALGPALGAEAGLTGGQAGTDSSGDSGSSGGTRVGGASEGRPAETPAAGGGASATRVQSAVPGGASHAASPGDRGLFVQDPNKLFRDDYMRALVGSTFAGANSPQLHEVMAALAKRPTGTQLRALLSRLAQLRGRALTDIEREYARFLQVDQAALMTAAGRHIAPPEMLAGAHSDFMGNTRQLRFGKVVGDAFGLDPAFGALLSPTGGLVGAGNQSVDAGAISNALGLGASPLAYHGVVHDAAGYLYTYHKAGPGYDYLGHEHGNTGDPLTGHEAGLRYWQKVIDRPSPVSATLQGAAWLRRQMPK